MQVGAVVTAAAADGTGKLAVHTFLPLLISTHRQIIHQDPRQLQKNSNLVGIPHGNGPQTRSKSQIAPKNWKT